MATLAKLKDLAARAGRWLGLATTPKAHMGAVETDRFDEMTWQETLTQAAALRELVHDLAERHNYASDLAKDVFMAAYKAAPALRERAEMDPSRLVNHHVIAAMMAAPEFAELRRDTVGDPYAAAMAVLAQASRLRRLLDQAKEAQQAADAAAAAQREAASAAQAVQQAIEQAADRAGEDGGLPAEAAATAEAAITRAEETAQAAQDAAAAASQALAAAGPSIRSAARAGLAEAARGAQEEAALMAAWGVTPGELQRMDFEQRRRLAERLRGSRLGRFAELVGRFRVMARAERSRKTEHAPGELVGIETGDDLSRLIPSELATLGVPALRAPFAVRLAEARLFTYATRGDERAGQGAIIACIDCSGSMSAPGVGGITGEAWAKACALALLDQARAARRDFAGILFGTARELQAFHFPAGQAPITEVLDFAEFFFGGGTDFAAPLDAAAGLLEAQYNDAGKQQGDIVLITDGECGVTDTWMRAYQDRKHRLGYRTFGVAIGRTPGLVLGALCDNVRSVTDLAEPATMRDIFRVI
jgi:uncharacterized protein with von Willebrand factor type A (vWA) domain